MDYKRIFEDWRWNRQSFPTKHVLICEDDLGCQQALLARFEKLFGGQGKVQVTVAAGAEMAAAILRSCAVDLILLDHDMPWGTGSALLVWMRAHGILVPVIVSSGLVENNKLMESMGGQHYGNKGDIIGGKVDAEIVRALGMERA